MELGSPEHKSLLKQGIIKVSLKIASMGLFLGVMFMIPSFVRENTFSMGLFYLGSAIVLGSALYATLLGYQKYQKLIKPFDQNH